MIDVMQAHRERIGRRIRMARVASGMSHDSLGAKVGTSRQHLIKLEKGQHTPRPEMIARLSEALGKDESYFLSEDDDEEPSEMVALLLQRAIDAAVREALRRLAPGSQVAA